MAHDLEASRHVLEHLRHILADLAHPLSAATRAGARGGLMDQGHASEMLGQLATGLLFRRFSGLGCGLRLDGRCRFGRRRLDLLELQLQLLDSAINPLGGLAERHAPQPSEFELQLLRFERLGDEPRLCGDKLRVARDDQALQHLDIVRKVISVKCHADLLHCFAIIPRASVASSVVEHASRCLPATSRAAPASASPIPLW